MEQSVELEASHFDSEVAYAAVNRFRLDDLEPYIYRTRDFGRSGEIIDWLTRGRAADTVREDPVRSGLLFAGTEKAVCFSFDDGDHWSRCS